MKSAAALLFVSACHALSKTPVDDQNVNLVQTALASDSTLAMIGESASCDVAKVHVSIVSPAVFTKLTTYNSCQPNPHGWCAYGTSWQSENAVYDIVIPSDTIHRNKVIHWYASCVLHLPNGDPGHLDERLWIVRHPESLELTVEGRALAISMEEGLPQ
jgi:hypothetical protein